MFFDAMINGGGESLVPSTKEEELLKQLIEKLNKPVYTYLYILTDNYVYLDEEGNNKCTKSYVENLFRTNPIYITKYSESNDKIFITEGILVGLYSTYDNGDYNFLYKKKNASGNYTIEGYVIDDINKFM